MATRTNAFEQFMLLFGDLRRRAETPQRLVSSFDSSKEMQASVEQLENWLLRTDFERRAFRGKKLVHQVPDAFKELWKDYEHNWTPALSHLRMRDIWPEIFGKYEPEARAVAISDFELDSPDPDDDVSFDPMHHNGGAAFQLAIDYLEDVYESRKDGQLEDDERIANICRVSLDAYDYLTVTIGLDVEAAFRRWQMLPSIFMPAAVSNKPGDERGNFE